MDEMGSGSGSILMVNKKPLGTSTTTRKGKSGVKPTKGDLKPYTDEEIIRLPLVLTLPEAARLLQVSYSTMREICASGLLPGCIKIGGRHRIVRDKIFEALGISMQGLIESYYAKKIADEVGYAKWNQALSESASSVVMQQGSSRQKAIDGLLRTLIDEAQVRAVGADADGNSNLDQMIA